MYMHFIFQNMQKQIFIINRILLFIIITLNISLYYYTLL